MASVNFEGKTYPIPESSDWTIAELSEAEQALGVALGNDSTADAMAITSYIAVRRVEKDATPVSLADRVRRLKLSDVLDDEEEADPLADLDGPPTSGMSSLEPTESLSASRT